MFSDAVKMIREAVLSFSVNQSVELPWHTFNSDDSIKIMMNFFIGGFWNILTDWISNPSKYSIDELAEKTTAALENVIMFIWFSLVHQPNLF